MASDKQKRPFITAKEAIIASIIIVFTGVVFDRLDLSPPPPEREVSTREAEIFAEDYIKEIDFTQITEIIMGGKPTFLSFYTSWCPYCKVLTANVVKLKRAGKTGDVNLLFISIDEDKTALSGYLLRHYYNKEFAAYTLQKGSGAKLKKLVTEQGGVYGKSIPYSAIFNKDGKFIGEIHGAANKNYLLELFAKLN